MSYGALTTEQCDALIINLAESVDSFTEKDAKAVLEWAHKVVTDKSLFDLVLSGQLSVRVDDGELLFKKKTIDVTGGAEDAGHAIA